MVPDMTRRAKVVSWSVIGSVTFFLGMGVFPCGNCLARSLLGESCSCRFFVCVIDAPAGVFMPRVRKLFFAGGAPVGWTCFVCWPSAAGNVHLVTDRWPHNRCERQRLLNLTVRFAEHRPGRYPIDAPGAALMIRHDLPESVLKHFAALLEIC